MDLGVRMLRSGYRAISDERRVRGGTGDFVTRLLGRRTLVVRGPDGVRLLYDEAAVRRRDAVPAPLSRLLFGKGAVHGLDDEEHRTRKALFLQILAPGRVERLTGEVRDRLTERVAAWRGREVVVFDELVEVYGASVLSWAGVACGAEEAQRVSRELALVVDGFGVAGLAYPRAWRARRRCERWATTLVEEVRLGTRRAPADSALTAIASGSGAGLSARVAAVELLNVLRPTVAVAWPATFAARALDHHPQWRPRLVGVPHEVYRAAFAHEVRRLTPFVPALAGRVRRSITHGDVRLKAGDRLVLDVPGTNTDPRRWELPDHFLPERFLGRDPGELAFVPQGGGETASGHRCPGEPLTVHLLQETVRVLAGVDYEVVSSPEVDETRIPTLPREGLRIRVTAVRAGPSRRSAGRSR